MFAWLIDRLPSVRLARDLAVARERVAFAEERLVDERRAHGRTIGELEQLRRKHDKLVEARLFKQGEITAPILTDPPKSSSSLPPSPFGAFGRLANMASPIERPTNPEPVGADVTG